MRRQLSEVNFFCAVTKFPFNRLCTPIFKETVFNKKLTMNHSVLQISKMASSMSKVFVYGTLKKGQPNHHWLTNTMNGAASYISNGTTKIKYPLVISTRYNIPFLLNKPGIGKNIKGEIYEIDDEMLSKLDILEDYPELYDRQIEQIVTKHG